MRRRRGEGVKFYLVEWWRRSWLFGACRVSLSLSSFCVGGWLEGTSVGMARR